MLNPLQEEARGDASEFGGGLTDGCDRGAEQGVEVHIVKAYKRDVAGDIDV